MKKLLALVLALVMTLGLATVGTSAAFTDEESIEHGEAVEILTSLGVINGMDDGTFSPKGNVTRAQMAKMIAIIMLGADVNDSAFVGTKSDLTDINGHWAEGFIKYCVSLGIVSGRGDGKFDPDDNVKTVEAAKMLLVALGYSSDVQEYTGDQWAINVTKDASTKKLYEDLTGMNADKEVTRDEAAQMIWNTVQRGMIIKSAGQERSSDGKITDQYTDTDLSGAKVTLLGQTFGGKVWIGTFTGNSNTNGSAEKDNITVSGSLESAYKSATYVPNDATFPSDYDITYIGEEVKVIFKDGTSGTRNQPDKYDTIYGVYNTKAAQVYNITKADLQDAKGEVANGKIKFGNSLYKVAASTTDTTGMNSPIIRNFGAAVVTAATIDANASQTGYDAAELADYINTAANGLRVLSADAIKFVCNENGEIERAYVLTTITSEVSSVSSSSIQMLGVASRKLEDCENVDGIAKGDLVRFAVIYPAANAVTRFYDGVSKVEGKITSYNSSDNQVQIDGTWYALGANTANVDGYTAGALASGNVDNTVSLAVNGDRFYVSYKVIDGYNNYAFLVDGDTTLGSSKAKAFLADTTEGDYVIDGDSQIITGTAGGTAYAATETFVDAAGVATALNGTYSGADLNTHGGNLFAYQLTSNGSKIKVTATGKTAVTDANGADGDTSGYVSNSKTLVTNDGTTATSHVVDPNAAVFLRAGTSWKVYTASGLKDFDFVDGGTVQYFVKDGKVVAFSGVTAAKPGSSTINNAFGFVTGKTNTVFDGDNVVQLVVWNGQSEDTLYLDGSTTTIAKGDFIYYPVSSGKVAISEIEYIANPGSTYTWAGMVKVKEYDTANKTLTVTTDSINPVGGAVVAGSDTNYKLSDSTKIIGVKTDGNKSSTLDTAVAYSKVAKRDYENAYLVLESKDNGAYYEVAALYVDEDNNITGTGDADWAYTVSGLSGAAGTFQTNNTSVTATVTPFQSYAAAGETVYAAVTFSGNSAASSQVNNITLTNATDAAVYATTGTPGAGVTSVTITGTNDEVITLTSAAAAGATAGATYIVSFKVGSTGNVTFAVD